MRHAALLLAALFLAALLPAFPAAAKTERRCGWYHNSSPANVILQDSDRQWWLSRQGGPMAPGFDNAYTPEFDGRLRIDYSGQVTNSYGYSCACVDGTFDAAAPEYEAVLFVKSLTEMPLTQCGNDPNLPVVHHSRD